jgi:hypothetical protein
MVRSRCTDQGAAIEQRFDQDSTDLTKSLVYLASVAALAMHRFLTQLFRHCSAIAATRQQRGCVLFLWRAPRSRPGREKLSDHGMFCTHASVVKLASISAARQMADRFNRLVLLQNGNLLELLKPGIVLLGGVRIALICNWRLLGTNIIKCHPTLESELEAACFRQLS